MNPNSKYAKHKYGTDWCVIVDSTLDDIALVQTLDYVTENGNTVTITIRTWHSKQDYTIKTFTEIMQSE